MNYFIIDDDPAIRGMLTEIIEDEDLGKVVGEAEDGALVNNGLLFLKKADVVLIDLLMPLRDGIETIRSLADGFQGRFVMISQVETKEMIGEAYRLGAEYYITKPLNQVEISCILNKVNERILVDQSIQGIQKSLNVFTDRPKSSKTFQTKNIMEAGRSLISDLGMIGEGGSEDLLNILGFLQNEKQRLGPAYSFPYLKEIFAGIAAEKLGDQAKEAEIQKEMKASEQRVRRALNQALIHIASLGLTDYMNPKFEAYSSTFFDFSEVRKKMLELEDKSKKVSSQSRNNMKKFIQVLFMEARQMMK
ncbi:response regulator [Peribacillus frigoritolerans]|jgi:two-component system response regulator YcbB|uniref:response regulator n=1 Tax=Peribacillus frigoritolerans TaxID=450367 RepID=UPI0007BF0B3C|nr:response regulator [Peribacillus frigoritolerans]MBD8135799.1 response regulator [Bacillus sp. CFBP 13597]MCU6602718.1 response regulator [Peribacillus frigoritolerans]MDG4848926.1 response regulator [Peribacillus frigoritolerans]MED3834321.1 response regulator [Peribacillus frigoritolerans]MED3847531.1 response regulator [Peribacillus frigoritolerans]